MDCMIYQPTIERRKPFAAEYTPGKFIGGSGVLIFSQKKIVVFRARAHFEAYFHFLEQRKGKIEKLWYLTLHN